MSARERTLRHVSSVTGEGGQPEVVITGAKLRIVNGLRATATANGLGNLIVGYNVPREDRNKRRTCRRHGGESRCPYHHSRQVSCRLYRDLLALATVSRVAHAYRCRCA